MPTPNNRSFIPVTNDVMFKAFFVRNPKLLQSFLSSVLNIPQDRMKNITIRNPELPPNFYKGKLTRLDILLEADDDIINIEMQVAKKEDYRERSLFYWARMYNEQIQKGNDYQSAKRCICINILSFTMFPNSEEYHSEFQVLEKNRYELLTDRLDIHFFELTEKKISDKDFSDEDLLKLWMQLFKAKREEEMEMLKETTREDIKSGVNVICHILG